MAAIAKDPLLALLATAKPNLFVLIRLEFDGRELASLMRAIAEGLSFAHAARTPPITFTGFHLDNVRCLLCDFGA
jgi:hypothetical protein